MIFQACQLYSCNKTPSIYKEKKVVRSTVKAIYDIMEVHYVQGERMQLCKETFLVF